ncbi:MAG: hypothetical protein K1X74_02505 [Pirellulales bacterium]|nr:hypothetical protein [Pirellulales bacterium]
MFRAILLAWLVFGGAQAVHSADVPRLLFTSQGRTGIVAADGSDLRYFDFQIPNQATWQPSEAFRDGRRILFLSMEPRRDGPGRPFEEYYTQTPTHLWIHDLADGSLQEICTQERKAPFVTPALLVGDDRLLIQVVKDRVGQIYSVKLDGSDAQAFTAAGEGLPYGLSLSPDRRRVAFHLASPEGYQVWTSDLQGRDRVKLAGHPEHLYFGTAWSPDGQWVVYVDCDYGHDPGHDWADVCIGRADGSEHRVLTQGQAMWFAASYGSASTRGGGSNVPTWTPDGAIVFPRRTPQARVPWQYQTDQADTDHFNRRFLPDQARGGTQIVRLDPRDGSVQELTAAVEGVWDFRASVSPDGQRLVFCRAEVGAAPAVWVAAVDGSEARRITGGIEDRGADHPRWLPPGN